MSNEVTVSHSLSIRKMDADGLTELIRKSYQSSYVDSMAGQAGPTPGVVTAALKGSGGTQVSFAQLTRPNWCWLEHLGRADGSASVVGDYVDVGMYDPSTHKFYPLMELRPGMRFPVPLSRNIQETFLGPGTGSAGFGEAARLMLVSYVATQRVSVEAYEV